MKKLAMTMIVEDGMLKLIQRPITGYLSKTKAEYRIDADGRTTNEQERVLVLGKDLRQDALWSAHASMDAMHQGYPGVVHSLKKYYYWPTLCKDAQDYCRRCRLCQLAKQSSRDRFE